MVLCVSNNIKQGSKYWQKLTGQMLFSISGRKPFSAPHSVSVVSASQHKVVRTCVLCGIEERKVLADSSLSNLHRVCFF